MWMPAKTIVAGIALLAVSIAFAPSAARAEAPPAQLCTGDASLAAVAPAALSRPMDAVPGVPDWEAAAFRGLSCSRCNSATQFCVLNPIRYEYACAPLGSVACISSTRTHWCPPNRGCWAGQCR
jgi:hypothetical protein